MRARPCSSSLDGIRYELDVSTSGAAKLRAALAPYIKAGRKLASQRSGRRVEVGRRSGHPGLGCGERHRGEHARSHPGRRHRPVRGFAALGSVRRPAAPRCAWSDSTTGTTPGRPTR